MKRKKNTFFHNSMLTRRGPNLCFLVSEVMTFPAASITSSTACPILCWFLDSISNGSTYNSEKDKWISDYTDMNFIFKCKFSSWCQMCQHVLNSKMIFWPVFWFSKSFFHFVYQLFIYACTLMFTFLYMHICKFKCVHFTCNTYVPLPVGISPWWTMPAPSF